ncbi:MAG: hypothetical protein LBD99_00655, partial [Candidatus Margulisbacteria bacterium]|nr:hypothetical protein [Candidatus Margulisiibacteriota bacterium]
MLTLMVGCGTTKQVRDRAEPAPVVVAPPEWSDGLTGIIVANDRTEYYQNETLDTSFISVTGVYNDDENNTKDVKE